jgi:hypothetical protein
MISCQNLHFFDFFEYLWFNSNLIETGQSEHRNQQPTDHITISSQSGHHPGKARSKPSIYSNQWSKLTHQSKIEADLLLFLAGGQTSTAGCPSILVCLPRLPSDLGEQHYDLSRRLGDSGGCRSHPSPLLAGQDPPPLLAGQAPPPLLDLLHQRFECSLFYLLWWWFGR